MKNTKLPAVLLAIFLSIAMPLTACLGEASFTEEGGITTYTFTQGEGEVEGTVGVGVPYGAGRESVDLGEDYVVQWVDAAFERLIRQALNKPSGDIHRSDLDAFLSFTIAGPDFIESNLSANNDVQIIGGDTPYPGLGMFSDTWYELGGERHTEIGEITRLDDLVHFKNLFSVRIQFNKINDISGLKDCPWLEDVFLTENEISDISALSGLTGLRWLMLRDNKISDLAPLSGLFALEQLSVSNNQISDIQPIKDLKNLQNIEVDRNQLVDLVGVSDLSKLSSLWAGENQIEDVSPLTDLSALQVVSLEQNKISDLQPLANLKSLHMLDLTGNPVEDWSPVAHVPTVEGRP